MQSKALKPLIGRLALQFKKEKQTLIGKTVDKITYAFKMYLYYPVDHFFSRYYERTTRSLAFAKHGWMHFDFESAYLYDIMAFKMKRIHRTLEKGSAVQEKENMDALKEAIKICERLFDGDYDDKYHAMHNKKWGKVKSKHIPEYDENGKIKHYRWETSRAKVKTAKQKEKERKEFMKCWEDAEVDRAADLDRLNEIFKKHLPTWWD